MMQNQRGHNKVIFFIGKLAADQVRIGKLSTIKHASVNLACDYLTHTVRIIRQCQLPHMRCQKLRHQPGACAKLKDALVSLRLNRIHNQLGGTTRTLNLLRVFIPLSGLVVKVMAVINHSRSLARLSVELRCFSMPPPTLTKTVPQITHSQLLENRKVKLYLLSIPLTKGTFMRLLPALAAAALALTLAPAAHAQSSANSTDWMSSLGSANGELSSGLAEGLSSGSLSSTGSSLAETHQEFSRNYGSSLAAIDTTFGVLGLLGDKSTILTDMWKSEQDIYPFPIDESITTANLVSRGAAKVPGIENWVVASP